MIRFIRRLFRREKRLRYPYGIPRKPLWLVDAEEEQIILKQLWSGREHG